MGPILVIGVATRLDQTGMTTRLRLVRMARAVKARADKARAIMARANRTLLLAILQLLLVGMQLLFSMAGLVPTSVLIAGSRATTRTRAPNWPLTTRSGQLSMDGSSLLVLVVLCSCTQRES